MCFTIKKMESDVVTEGLHKDIMTNLFVVTVHGHVDVANVVNVLFYHIRDILCVTV